MNCLSWWLPFFLLPLPICPPEIFALFLLAYLLRTKPCVYCCIVLSGLFFATSYWSHLKPWSIGDYSIHTSPPPPSSSSSIVGQVTTSGPVPASASTTAAAAGGLFPFLSPASFMKGQSKTSRESWRSWLPVSANGNRLQVELPRSFLAGVPGFQLDFSMAGWGGQKVKKGKTKAGQS